MCRLKSGLLFKDRVFLPDYNSHGDMLDELGIKDDYIGARKKFVRFEVYPAENGSVFTDPKDWIYNVDQDILPDWYDAKECEKRAMQAVSEWWKKNVHIGTSIDEINSGVHYICSCNVNNICGDATVDMVCGNATINTVTDNATVNYVNDNAMLKYVCGDATVYNVYGDAYVKFVYGNATIKSVFGNATINSVFGNATVKSINENAIVIRGRKIIVADDSGYEMQKGV